MTHPLDPSVVDQAVQCLAENGFDGMAETFQLLLNECMKIERQQELCAAAHEDGRPAAREDVDHFAHLGREFIVRNTPVVEPRAEGIEDPIALSLIDLVKLQSRFLVPFRHEVAQVVSEVAPAQRLGHQLGD